MNLTTFEQFKEAFETALSKSKKPENLIDNEISDIEHFLKKEDVPRQKRFRFHITPPSVHIFKLHINKTHKYHFVNAFNDFNLIGKHDSDMANSEVVEQARQFCQYYNWLKSLKKAPNRNLQKNGLSYKQKMLALHYMGLDLSKYDNTTYGNILGEVLGLDRGNTRKYLSYVCSGKNDVRTIKNLQVVLNLFEAEHLTDISSKIRADMDTLSK